jgi:hypothetical protein
MSRIWLASGPRRRRRKDRLHHPGQSTGERVHREFKLRLFDELLDEEIFCTLREAEIVIESWRRYYNMVRPHASIGYRRCSCPRAPHGRLRNPDELRRPCSSWYQKPTLN